MDWTRATQRVVFALLLGGMALAGGYAWGRLTTTQQLPTQTVQPPVGVVESPEVSFEDLPQEVKDLRMDLPETPTNNLLPPSAEAPRH